MLDESYACITQGFGCNGVVAKKIQRNFRLPDEVLKPFESLYPKLKTRGWITQTAAMLAFMDLPAVDRDKVIGEVLAADSMDRLAAVVEKATGGQLFPDDNGPAKITSRQATGSEDAAHAKPGRPPEQQLKSDGAGAGKGKSK